MKRSTYVEEKQSLYRLNHLAELALSDKPFVYKSDKSGVVSTIKIKSINISSKEGIYITGTITNDSGMRLRSDSDDKVTIVPASYFKHNAKLRDRLDRYLMNRPRLKVVPAIFDLGNGEKSREDKVMCLFMNDEVYKSGLISYTVVELFDSEGRFIQNTMKLAKDFDAREMIYLKKTIQGRLSDPALYNAVTLTLNGYTRGVVKDNVIYSRTVSNGEVRTTPIAVSAFNYYGYKECDVSDRVELEKFSCPVKTARYDNGAISYIKIANILDMGDLRDSHYDIIQGIRKYKHGLVYLKNTMAEEIISLIFTDAATLIADKGKVNNTVFGSYITHKGEPLFYTNPDVEVISIPYDNFLKDSDDEISDTNTLLKSKLGSTDHAMDFYIIDADVSIPPDILSALCENALVFVLSEFNNLCGIARRFKDSQIDLSNIIFMGSLYDREGLFMHPFLKKLMEDGNYSALEKIPMSTGKLASNGEWLDYNDLLGNILYHEKDISTIILTNRVQVVRKSGIYQTTAGYDELDYGELLHIYMDLSDTDIFETMNDVGICNVMCDYRTSVKSNDRWIERRIPVKMTVTEMRNVIDRSPLKMTFKPIILASNESYLRLSSLFTSTSRGLQFLCGDSNSGKKSTVLSICQNLPNRGSVLIFDSEYEITEEFFKNDNHSEAMSLDLTISRSHNVVKIENLLMTKPDVVIVFKLSSYNISFLKLLLSYYNPTQKMIIVYDGLFTDMLDRVDTWTANRTVDCLELATNQIKLTMKDGKQASIYESLDPKSINKLTIDRSSQDVRKISGSIYNFLKEDSQGIHRQLAELQRDGKIDSSVARMCLNSIKRHYL